MKTLVLKTDRVNRIIIALNSLHPGLVSRFFEGMQACQNFLHLDPKERPIRTENVQIGLSFEVKVINKPPFTF